MVRASGMAWMNPPGKRYLLVDYGKGGWGFQASCVMDLGKYRVRKSGGKGDRDIHTDI